MTFTTNLKWPVASRFTRSISVDVRHSLDTPDGISTTVLKDASPKPPTPILARIDSQILADLSKSMSTGSSRGHEARRAMLGGMDAELPDSGRGIHCGEKVGHGQYTADQDSGFHEEVKI